MRSGAAAGVAGVGAADGAARSQPASSEAWRWAPSLPRRTPTTDMDLAMAMPVGYAPTYYGYYGAPYGYGYGYYGR